jgi:hypothetical protein
MRPPFNQIEKFLKSVRNRQIELAVKFHQNEPIILPEFQACVGVRKEVLDNYFDALEFYNLNDISEEDSKVPRLYDILQEGRNIDPAAGSPFVFRAFPP